MIYFYLTALVAEIVAVGYLGYKYGLYVQQKAEAALTGAKVEVKKVL